MTSTSFSHHDQGGIVGITRLLSESRSPEIMANCLRSTFNLSSGPRAQQAIIDGGGVPVVVDVSRRPDTPVAYGFRISQLKSEISATLCETERPVNSGIYTRY